MKYMARNLATRKAQRLGRLRSCHQHAIQDDKSGATGILEVNLARHPPTVARLIPSVIVDPVQVHAWRPLPHIGEKCSEIGPSWMNRKPPPAIVAERRIIGVPASCAQSNPYLIGCRTSHPMFRDNLLHRATARGRVLLLTQVKKQSDGLITAQTSETKTPMARLGLFHFAQNGKSSEHRSCRNFKPRSHI